MFPIFIEGKTIYFPDRDMIYPVKQTIKDCRNGLPEAEQHARRTSKRTDDPLGLVYKQLLQKGII
jgi:hypothetical protein